MMKTARNIFFALGIMALIVLTLALWEKERNSRPFKRQKFNSSIKVHNKTDYKRADTICLVLADKLFDLDSAQIYLLDLKQPQTDIKYHGITHQLHFDPYVFYIYLADDMGMGRLKRTLCHEFIHVEQFARGDLVYRAPHYYWKGEIVLPVTPYKQRAFEIEAFNNTGQIFKQLNYFLY